MINFAKILSTALSLMATAEQNFPQAGLGKTKKEIVLNGVELALQTAGGVATAAGQPEIAAVTAIVGAFIDSTVGLLNKAGVFKSSSPQTSPA